MAKEEQVKLLKKSVKGWNAWRQEYPKVHIDLSMANLPKANLSDANLIGANLSKANLSYANLFEANLFGGNLSKADLSKANLAAANLIGANLSEADLAGADLAGADLERVQLVETNLKNTNLQGCRIYGISAWSLQLAGTKQQDLIITREDEPVITVDNLEVAQFIYLLLNNKKIRDIIDTITSKTVLILGRFTPERKAVLDTLREDLRKRNYLPNCVRLRQAC
jgi:hypothetical protein